MSRGGAAVCYFREAQWAQRCLPCSIGVLQFTHLFCSLANWRGGRSGRDAIHRRRLSGHLVRRTRSATIHPCLPLASASKYTQRRLHAIRTRIAVTSKVGPLRPGENSARSNGYGFGIIAWEFSSWSSFLTRSNIVDYVNCIMGDQVSE